MIDCRDLSKSFGKHLALDRVNLAVAAGEFFSLLGPSGCGKTTLLRLIGGFEQPDSGVIFIDGEDLTARPPYRRPVNQVFQSYALFPHLSVEQNIAFGLKMSGVPRPELRRRVAEAIDTVSLAGLEQRKPAQLSGGQKQRVALAPRDHQPAQSFAARRAARRPRCPAAPRRTTRTQTAAAASRHHVHLRHARSG